MRLLASLYGIPLDIQKASGFSNDLQTIGRLIADYGDCLSFDSFKAVKNEREAEKLALAAKGFPPIASMSVLAAQFHEATECSYSVASFEKNPTRVADVCCHQITIHANLKENLIM